MQDRIDGLINLLFDNTATITERDEAATYLGDFSDSRVVSALILKAKDTNEDEIVLNSCGESLGMIWTEQNSFDENAYRSLIGSARFGVYCVVKSRHPKWIDQFQLEEDAFRNDKHQAHNEKPNKR